MFQNFPNFPNFKISKFLNFEFQKVFWNLRCYQHRWCLYFNTSERRISLRDFDQSISRAMLKLSIVSTFSLCSALNSSSSSKWVSQAFRWKGEVLAWSLIGLKLGAIWPNFNDDIFLRFWRTKILRILENLTVSCDIPFIAFI